MATEVYRPRRVVLDKARAISTARNPKESCLGQALLKNTGYEGRLLSGELGKIGSQSRRQQMHLEQQRKRFLKSHELPQPTIIVSRPPSPEIMRKALFPELYNDDAYYFDPALPPHYMKPLDSQRQAKGTLHTMDMYKVKTKKKVNVWEEVLIEKEKPRFESAVKPSYRLSTSEQHQLQKGWFLQKRRLEQHVRQLQSLRRRPTTRLGIVSSKSAFDNLHEDDVRPSSTPQNRRMKSNHHLASKSTPIVTAANGMQYTTPAATFITELPYMRNGFEPALEDENGVCKKSVSFQNRYPLQSGKTNKANGTVLKGADLPGDDSSRKNKVKGKKKTKKKLSSRTKQCANFDTVKQDRSSQKHGILQLIVDDIS